MLCSIKKKKKANFAHQLLLACSKQIKMTKQKKNEEVCICHLIDIVSYLGYETVS